jgi:hypothetical protein
MVTWMYNVFCNKVIKISSKITKKNTYHISIKWTVNAPYALQYTFIIKNIIYTIKFILLQHLTIYMLKNHMLTTLHAG